MKNENNKLEISKKIDNQLTQIFSDQQLSGFSKAVKLADGITQLRELLDKDYMESIMKLQGSRIGYRTDKDKTGGYDMATVKDALIEAVLIGLSPVGNMFNIIASSCYITKEGAEHLLKQQGVSHVLRFGPVSIDQKNKVAKLDVEIEYTYEGKKHKETVPVSVKWNQYMSEDAIFGKATRKARVWLYNKINNTYLTDGDVSDIPHVVISDSITKESIQELLDDKKELVGKDGNQLLTEKEISYIELILSEEREKDYKKAYDFLNDKQ